MNNDRWRESLSDAEYYVCREKGTEPPFSGEYVGYKGAGVFACKCCGERLFEGGAKFDSGTGWPSFFDVIEAGKVRVNRDVSHGMVREEVVCAGCDAHLGHVFPDGPAPTGLRYCINSLSLTLEE